MHPRREEMKTKFLALFFLTAVTVSALGLFIGVGRNGNNAENNARQFAAAAAGVRFNETGGGYCCYGRKLVLDRVDRVR